MNQQFDIPRLLLLRRLTNAIATHIKQQLDTYLAILRPLFDPRNQLGDFIRGASKHQVKGAEKAFKVLNDAYRPVANTRPFNLQGDLKPPLDIFGVSADVTAAEYLYQAASNGQTKTVTVISPLKWVLSYRDLGPRRVRELLATHSGTSNDELRSCILHYLVMNNIVSQSPGVGTLLDGLRFTIEAGRYPAFGELPVLFVQSPVTTLRPPDDIIIQSTEISGTHEFEEVVNVEDITNMKDAMKDRLIQIVRDHDESLLD